MSKIKNAENLKPLCLQFDKDFHMTLRKYTITNEISMQDYIENLIIKELGRVKEMNNAIEMCSDIDLSI